MPIPTRSGSLREPRKQVSLWSGSTVRGQREVTQTQGQAQAQKEAPASAPTLASRRQSLMRPSPLKTATTLAPSTRTTPVAPSSPRKQEPKPRVPTSPKKTDMPPPPLPRHGRSISLRQPVSSSPATATAPRGHLRQRSQVLASASRPPSPRKTEASIPSTPTTPRTRTQFSTYQQSSSPKKTVKPPTPTPSNTSSTDTDPSLIPSSLPEVAALQTEVLQLSLLHSSSLEENADWQAQSEKQLRKKYDAVAASYRRVVAEEKERQRRLNGQALAGWLQNSHEHNGQQVFAEQIQVLSEIAQEVSDLSDSSGAGRYTLAIQEFEDWLRKANEIKKWRSRIGPEDAADQVVFIDPLNRAWKEEMYALVMKLELCSRQLQSLDILGYGDMENLQDSALLRTAKGLNDMINLMIEETTAIRSIEDDIVKAERIWVSHLTEQLADARPRDERGLRVGMWRRRG
ncbi:hypothetical protein ASPWEDRAFT_103349 [Aspergillus wentii DTO 134E9]|uniref:Uncharacterized protein n=1 Tax=Aspergillus wentii DTO 134E9 TaxID=1073089 RepID=A0A1L9RY07_ASPWE|nr:uncharacterized protein ASPWEDRAFT_103349 [Aspergillus wentii DTO 134E9]OJJ39773.1 hypothetical protein ASPWEDRAFT_103349 [Aspergillus wentii DTO 134E9]